MGMEKQNKKKKADSGFLASLYKTVKDIFKTDKSLKNYGKLGFFKSVTRASIAPKFRSKQVFADNKSSDKEKSMALVDTLDPLIRQEPTYAETVLKNLKLFTISPEKEKELDKTTIEVINQIITVLDIEAAIRNNIDQQIPIEEI